MIREYKRKSSALSAGRREAKRLGTNSFIVLPGGSKGWLLATEGSDEERLNDMFGGISWKETAETWAASSGIKKGKDGK
jgi:hypothetical protein